MSKYMLIFTTVHKSIRFVRPSTSQKDMCIPSVSLMCCVTWHFMVWSAQIEKKSIDFYDEIFEIPWKVESPD